MSNTENKKILESLESPDFEDSGKFEFDYVIQREILATLLHDKYFLIQGISLIKPEYFVVDSYKFICEELFHFFEEHKQQPQLEYLIEEINSKIKSDAKYRYVAQLKEVNEIYEGNAVSRSYLLNKLVEFAKRQAFKSSISRICDLFKENPANWGQVEDEWRRPLEISPQFEPGLHYFVDYESFLDGLIELDEHTERFSSGFSPIDDRITGGGLARGEIGAWVGSSGSGKSLLLVQAAVKNLMRGKKVLYISTEMDEKRIGQRFTSHFAFMPQEQINIKENKTTIVKAINARLREIGKDNPLCIKQFPAGTADVNDLRAFISQLKLRNFNPDLLIVDYVGELKDFANMKVWESRQRLVRDLRALGVEENYCVLTALQPNREGRKLNREGDLMDDSEIGDSYGQIRPLDACWSINQNREQQKANVGRIFIMKTRNGISKVELFFKRTKTTLSFEPISNQTYLNELNKLKANEAENTIDEITSLEVNKGENDTEN